MQFKPGDVVQTFEYANWLLPEIPAPNLDSIRVDCNSYLTVISVVDLRLRFKRNKKRIDTYAHTIWLYVIEHGSMKTGWIDHNLVRVQRWG